jgi:diphosphomevalonate decarboxylase
MKPSLIEKVTGRGPINIAIIKYWGKEDEENIIPLNNSISITLDMNKFYTETTATLIESKNNPEISELPVDIILNGKAIKVSGRVRKIINIFCKKEYIPNFKLEIESINTFPTAAGCASSASSMACLVNVLNELFKAEYTKHQLSSIARLGSGSACRSIFPGLVEWEKCSKIHNDESVAIQIVDNNYWSDLKILLLVVNDTKKDTSSTDGMKLSKETSSLLKLRVSSIVPERIEEMKKAIFEKDFNKLAELTMKDSNNFHAVCQDTYPPIHYLNDTSKFIIKTVHMMNKIEDNKAICAYTFDAGPNAFILVREKDEDVVVNFFKYVFMDENVEFFPENNMTENNLLATELKKIASDLIIQRKNLGAKVLEIIQFSLGIGATVI